MAEIRTLIVDDEPLARRGVRQLLEPYPDFFVMGECRDGREAIRVLATRTPDLIFLDIQMPGVSGFDVVRLHGEARMPPIVFVTAHLDYAVRAFEAQAIDYLVKPLDEARFRATISRVRERLQQCAAKRESAIVVPTREGQLLLHSDEIFWANAEDDYVIIHARGGTFRMRGSLSALEERLDPHEFTRVHRSAIVRLREVREWRNSGPSRDALLILRNGAKVQVSRRRISRVRELVLPSS